jgi:hypothetical protein
VQWCAATHFRPTTFNKFKLLPLILNMAAFSFCPIWDLFENGNFSVHFQGRQFSFLIALYPAGSVLLDRMATYSEKFISLFFVHAAPVNGTCAHVD